MAQNKKTFFSDMDQRLAEFTKALSHPARIQIIRKLSETDSCICGDLVDELPLAQSTVSQHLSELKKVGLIKGTIDGPRSCYCLDAEVWKELNDSLTNYTESVRASIINSNCC